MKNNIKYIISLIVLTVAFICLGNMAMAENHKIIANEAIEEKEVIKAEDIGIKTVEKVVSEEQPISAEAISKDTTVNENSVDKNFVYKEETESTDKDESIEDESLEDESIEDEPLEVPEGLFEGYEEGIYFEPNCFDCELHEYCYKCEEHEIEIEYFWDEEINPNEGWVRSETCIVCGHGSCKPITEEEIE